MYLFLKSDASVSIFMIIMYTNLVSLTLFLCIYFTCICIHMHSHRCHVLYTIEFNIIILTAQYMVYHNRVVSCMGGGPRVVVSTAAFHARVRGSVPGLGGLKETKLFLPHPRVKVSIVGSLRGREVACSASDRQGSNFESCVWGTVSSQSSHHPQEVLLAQFSLYVHKGGLKPDSFHFLVFCIFHITITLKYWF